MKSNITYLLVCIFLLTAFSAKAQRETFTTADSLLSMGRYGEASLELERICFENRLDQSLVVSAVFKKVECLKLQQKYQQIPNLLSRLDELQPDDSLQQEIRLQKALGYYLSDQFEKAEKSILPVFNLSIYNTQTWQLAATVYVLSLNEQGKWSQAHQFLNGLLKSDTSLSEENERRMKIAIDSLYNPENIPKMKSIRKARTLSLIFPGAGQAYNGNFGKGFVNLLLVSGSAGFTVYNVLQTNYITAATAGVYLFLYFYFGGANQSNWLVPVKNQRKKAAFNQQLKAQVIGFNKQLFQQ